MAEPPVQEVAQEVPEKVENAETKFSFRKRVWTVLEKNNLVSHPRPVYGRIPNFKGCEEAAALLAELDEFKSARNVKVNPDKPQKPVRCVSLEHGKNLFVPIPRLASGLLKRIAVPENGTREEIYKAVSRKEIEENGTDVEVHDDVSLDLVVLGSVAVSKQGYRIGKGKGYADLEFAILSHIKAVNENTIVATTVHDEQVFETLPETMFKPHDVPVDIIVTPTRVIRVENRLAKPTGIIWGILSQRRVNLMPLVLALRTADEKEGKEVSLKDEDTDVENYKPFYSRRYGQYHGRRLRSKAKSTDSPDKSENEVIRPIRRRFARKGIRQNTESTENEGDDLKRKPKKPFRRNLIDFSLMVRNIERNVRVRDLKAALAERGIKPKMITWRGIQGYCCLHFSKAGATVEPNGQPEKEAHAVDNVIGMLQNLRVSPDSKKQLTVQIMKPISRIETTDVTAV